MRPEDLAKSVTFLFDSLTDWATAVRQPLETGLAIIRDKGTSLDAIRVATKLWVVALLLSAVLQIPLYQLQGISWTNIGFHLSTGLVLLSILVVGNLSLYVGCAIFRVRVDFAALYVFYTVLVAVFSPLFTLLSYPMSLSMFAALKETRAKGLDLTAAAAEIFKGMSETTSAFFAIYVSISTVLFGLLVFAMLTCLVHVLSSRYSLTRHSLINAFAFGLVVGAIPSAFFNLLYVFTLYAFL